MNRRWKNALAALLAGGILAGELAVITDLLLAWRGISMSCSVFLLSAAALMLALFWLFRRRPKPLGAAVLAVQLLLAVVVLGGYGIWKSFSETAVYQDVDSGKEGIYSGHKVMLITPHQDDDINVLGGVMEEYVKYGSQLYPVFVTNGDFEGLAQTRFAEALEVYRHIGVPEENVIFLGYGDQWAQGGPHLYNAQPGQVMTSANGHTKTYSTQAKSVFREGRDYTAENLLEDLEAVILTYRPDVIFCSDYDSHIDHKAVTLFFEKAMGNILKAYPDYRPTVYKGYAYKSAWYAEPDFYETNLRSTQDVFSEPYWQRPEVYRWEDRVRFPVGPDTLSRSIFSSDTYYTLSLYASQETYYYAAGIINGDKVVWQRRTDSASYDAVVEVSSGNGAVLNDFMLVDNFHLADETHMPYDGVWVPDDGEKTVALTLDAAQPVDSIVLYDHPSEKNNVLNAEILFDDGTRIQTGPLHPGGAATEIPVEKAAAASFTVTLTETEGEGAGLSEIEIFREKPAYDGGFLKLMDENGDFAYDYWTEPEGTAEFSLYCCGDAREGEEDLFCNNEKVTALWQDGKLTVNCPAGESAVISVTRGTYADSILVSNPGIWKRLQCTIAQWLEETLFQGWCAGLHRNSAVYTLLDTIR